MTTTAATKMSTHWRQHTTGAAAAGAALAARHYVRRGRLLALASCALACAAQAERPCDGFRTLLTCACFGRCRCVLSAHWPARLPLVYSLPVCILCLVVCIYHRRWRAVAAVTTTLMTTPNWRQHITEAAVAGTVLAARLRFRRDRLGCSRVVLSPSVQRRKTRAVLLSRASFATPLPKGAEGSCRCRRHFDSAQTSSAITSVRTLHQLLRCHRLGVSAYRRVAFSFVPCPSMS